MSYVNPAQSDSNDETCLIVLLYNKRDLCCGKGQHKISLCSSPLCLLVGKLHLRSSEVITVMSFPMLQQKNVMLPLHKDSSKWDSSQLNSTCAVMPALVQHHLSNTILEHCTKRSLCHVLSTSLTTSEPQVWQNSQSTLPTDIATNPKWNCTEVLSN